MFVIYGRYVGKMSQDAIACAFADRPNMTRRLLIDDMTDPKGWFRKLRADEPEDFVCVDSRLDKVNFSGGVILLRVSCKHRSAVAALDDNSFRTLTLPQAMDIFTKYRGKYLLSALAHKITV